MCGIGGVLMKSGQKMPNAVLDKMRAALGKRGPDGHGQFSNEHIGLVHTRLAIIDPTGGQQPITDAKGRVIVFNGEIYNYVEIWKSLREEYNFKTNSDTETILALYDRYELDFVNHLRGMYAFALYDPAIQRLIIARDPFGIKPLYITENANYMAFASEPKAILQSGLAPSNMDVSILRSVIANNYIRGITTPYTEIQRLNPGEMRVYEYGTRVHSSTRHVLPETIPQDIDEDVALSQLNAVLEDTVAMHCRSDVGYGIFLSGGVDSSTIMRVLANQENPERIKAYTAYFETPDAADERDYARAVAEACGADMHEVSFGAADFTTLLPQIAGYMDDPVADYAILPTWKLASVAAKEQKVVLCGEGGDELFAGYGRYRPRWWKDWRKSFREDDTGYADGWTRLQREQARDIAGYLPNDLLVKLDTCLMAHGLEGRTPFLDPEVAAFAFALPDNMKLRSKDGKYLLKKWLDMSLPEAKPFRKKQGFTVPVGVWMAEDAKRLTATLTSNAFVRELLTSAEVRRIGALMQSPKTATECWSLLYLALWYMAKQGRGQGGIADMLAA